MSWCYFISCKIESYPREMEYFPGMREFHSKAALSVSIQLGQFGPVSFRRTLNSEACSANRMKAIEECFMNFSQPGINCWESRDLYGSESHIKNSPSPGDRLPVVIDPSLPQELRDFLQNLVKNQNRLISA